MCGNRVRLGQNGWRRTFRTPDATTASRSPPCKRTRPVCNDERDKVLLSGAEGNILPIESRIMKKFSMLLALLAVLLEGLSCPQSAVAQDQKSDDLYKKALALAKAGKLAEAEEPVSTLLAQANDQVAQLLMLRASLRAQAGRFQDAVGDLEQVIQINPSNHWPWFILTPLLIQTGETTKYRTQCKEMLRRFYDTTDVAVAERVAKSCLLLPSALDPVDSIRAAELADNSVALTKRGELRPYPRMTKGLAEYRRGRFARAIETIDLLLKEMSEAEHAGQPMTAFDDCKADTYFISAMAHHQLKETDQARSALNLGREIVRTKLPGADDKNLGPDWWAPLLTHILMSEAIKTVGASTPVP